MIQTGQTKFIAGGLKIPVTLTKEGSRVFIQYPYNKLLIEEVKMMEGAKYHGYDQTNPRKIWSVADTYRNNFQIEYLKGNNPYAPYETDLPSIHFPARYNLFKKMHCEILKHQCVMAWHQIIRRYCVVCGEMGTGKTLANLLAAEHQFREAKQSGKLGEFWYIAPRAAIKAVQRDHYGWESRVPFTYMTYEEMVKRMKEWMIGQPAPQFVVFDESSKLKNPQAQRSIAAKALADAVRKEWGPQGSVILMSGSPAPKSPADWFWQSEVACPGFLREGDIHKFKNRLGIIEMKESVIQGGVYPQLVSWRDDERKCNVCGQFKEHENHHPELCPANPHAFIPSKNEVQYLYERLKGLVVVFFKKDCLDLPEKHYKIIEVKPNPSILRAAKVISKAAKTVIEGLTNLRELSDGFQYTETPKGKETCSLCRGSKVSTEYEEVPGTCPTCKDGIPGIEHWVAKDEFDKPVCPNHNPERKPAEVSCTHCGGAGEVQTYERGVKEIPTPKDQVLVELLDEHEEVGRIVIFAGFTASIDRCIRICHKEQWHTIRVDQGRWIAQDPEGRVIPEKDFLSMFQDKKEEYPRVAFVAHPGSGGMGLTLTASPTILYFSNDFNAENRIQSEDRIHRPGMDANRGATIIDIVHLPTDQKILDNLKKKRELQSLTLGEFADALHQAELSEERRV